MSGGLFNDHKDDLPEEWHDTFDQLTSQGRAPSSIKATIEYVSTEKSQSDVSDEFSVSEPTIRSLQAAVVALGPIDHATGTRNSRGGMSSMDYCTHIADRLGLKEGTHYSVRQAYSGQTKQPSIRKEGWRAIYEALVSDGDADE
jgi:hypothetical protein